MKNRLRLRRDQPGEVFLGSYEYNQPERIRLTQDQPFVDEALRAKGFSDEEIDSQMVEYEIYIPQVLARVPQSVSAADLVEEVEAVAVAVDDSDVLVEDSDVEEEEVPSEEVPPEEVVDEPEELRVDDVEDVKVPPVEELKDMTRDDLVALAERLGIESSIQGTGANGYVTVPDLRRFLVPYVEELIEG